MSVNIMNDQRYAFTEKEKGTYLFSFTRFIVYHPFKMCSFFFFVMLLLAVITQLTGLMVISDDSEFTWVIAATEESQNNDALNSAISQVDVLAIVAGERLQQFDMNFNFIYESKNGQDIFEISSLRDMCEVESLAVLDPKYLNLCPLDKNNECILPTMSPVVYFYEFQYLSDWNCSKLNVSRAEAKRASFYEFAETPIGKGYYGTWLDSGYESRKYSTKAISPLTFGSPLANFSSASDREEEQWDEILYFLTDGPTELGGIEIKLFDRFGMKDNLHDALPYYLSPYMASPATENIYVIWFSDWNVSNEFSRVVNSDLLFSFCSLIFVWFWIFVHTNSFFISFMAIYMIFMSIPVSVIVYKVLYRISYYSELHTLVIFICMGVGADDVFVLVDSWKYSQKQYEGNNLLGAKEDEKEKGKEAKAEQKEKENAGDGHSQVLNDKTVISGNDQEGLGGGNDEKEQEEQQGAGNEGEINYPRYHRRMYGVLHHTIATVFNTSFTTSVAFLATGASPLMPISTFGWFAATCIVMNYIFVITLMPCVVLLNDMFDSKMKGRRKKEEGGNNKGDEGGVEATSVESSTTTQAAPAPDSELAIATEEAAGAGSEGMHPTGSSSSSAAATYKSVDATSYKSGAGLVDYSSSKSTSIKSSSSSSSSSSKSSKSLSSNTPMIDMYIKFITYAIEIPAYIIPGSTVSNSPSDKSYKLAIPQHFDEAEAKKKAMEQEGEASAAVVDEEGNGKAAIGTIAVDSNTSDPYPNGGLRKVPIVAVSFAIGLLIFGIVSVNSGVKLEPPVEQEMWFKPDHMFTKFVDVLQSGFLTTDNTETLTFTFGIDGIDRGEFSVYEPQKNRGTAEFDVSWYLYEPSCQQAFMRMCDDIEAWDCDSTECGPTRKLAKQDKVQCFYRSYYQWVNTTYNTSAYTLDADTFNAYLETFRQDPTNEQYADQIGFIDGNLKYASMVVDTTMFVGTPLNGKLDVQDSYKGFINHVKSYDECQVCDCNSLMASDTYAFVWMKSEEGLVSGFYQGMLIAFPVAFVVLLFATDNIIISVGAIITVFLIVFGVLGFVNYGLGWSLGVAESIAGIIIIGFSVDYTVHIGHIYTEEESGETREAKFDHTSRKIVVTIVGGAITTAGAGAFLFACQLTFFTKMATLIVSTIFLSFIFSLFFFMSMLYLLGPSGDTGKISPFLKKIYNKIEVKICPERLDEESDDKENEDFASEISEKEVQMVEPNSTKQLVVADALSSEL